MEFNNSEPEQEINPADIIKDMSQLDRLEYKRTLLSEISDRESLVHLINAINKEEGFEIHIIG